MPDQVLSDKEQYVLDMFKASPTMSVSAVRKDLVQKYGTGMMTQRIYSLREMAVHENENRSATLSERMKGAAARSGAGGIRKRVVQPATAPVLPEPKNLQYASDDGMQWKEIQDVVSIIKKRIPGLQKLVIQANAQGEWDVQFEIMQMIRTSFKV